MLRCKLLASFDLAIKSYINPSKLCANTRLGGENMDMRYFAGGDEDSDSDGEDDDFSDDDEDSDSDDEY